MKIEVYHAISPDFFMNDAQRVIAGKQFADKSKFKHVATVEFIDNGVDAFNTDDVLDFAYERTNTIHNYWGDNKQVTQHTERNRSTSCGDLLLYDDEVYVVASFGFMFVGFLTDLRGE